MKYILIWHAFGIVLPPYRIIGQLCILRQTLTINFSQKNMGYLT
jgi:hypothetical protein